MTADGQLYALQRLELRCQQQAEEIVHLKTSLTDCSKEYHAAINEPEYAGTRQDWIWRAQRAEAEVHEQDEVLARQTTRIQELEAGIVRMQDEYIERIETLEARLKGRL